MKRHLRALEEPSTNVEMFPTPNTLAHDAAVVQLGSGMRLQILGTVAFAMFPTPKVIAVVIIGYSQ